MPLARIWLAAIACWGLLTPIVGCSGPERAALAPASEEANPRAVAEAPLRVVPLRLERWPQTVRVQGNLRADERVTVGTKVAGLVVDAPVDIGAVVRAGDLLARLDGEEFDLEVRQVAAQLTQGRARLGLRPGDSDERLDPLSTPLVRQERALLDEAQSLLDRALALYEQHVVTLEELQTREAAVQVALARHASAVNQAGEQIAQLEVHRAQLALAEHRRRHASIVAPFDGVVAERLTAPGAYLQLGDPVVALVRIDPLRFRAGVPELEALQLRPGMPLRLRIVGEGEPRWTEVARISPGLEAASRALFIEAAVDNPSGQLRGGLFAEAEIIVNSEAQVLAAPETAVTQFAGVQKLWVVEEGVARLQRVRTGRRQGGLVEVLEGVSAGQLIAVDAALAHAGAVSVVLAEHPPDAAE